MRWPHTNIKVIPGDAWWDKAQQSIFECCINTNRCENYLYCDTGLAITP